MVKSVPRRDHWIEVRFEDSVPFQQRTLQRHWDFVEPSMCEFGYEIPH